MKLLKILLASACALAAVNVCAHGFKKPVLTIELSVLGQYHSGIFNQGGAEIVAHDPRTQRLFAVNAADAAVDVLDITDPSLPVKITSIDASALGGSANSVDIAEGIAAVAIEAADRQQPGLVAFYRTRDLQLLKTMPVGAVPDMVTFSPDGRYVLVANEGEPSSDYANDPEGSVSIIDLSRGLQRAVVRTASFAAFNDSKDTLTAAGVRIYGPGATVAQDLEPEYIAITRDSKIAYVTLQENNAIARIDIRRAEVKQILPLGYKDYSLPANALDASDRDGGINIRNWPVLGMYQPDSIAGYEFRGKAYLVTANEGDARAYDAFTEEGRVRADVMLDPVAFPDFAQLRDNANIGRLRLTTATGDIDGDGDFDQIYTYGARSFSIWDTAGRLIYDSGDDFEQKLAISHPEAFNSGHDSNMSFDTRSDDKGPEPEGLALGEIAGRTYAFVGLERIGGIMVYDITNPLSVEFVQYINNRNFTEQACLLLDDEGECVAGAGNSNPAAGDLGPEGLRFIPAHRSPIRRPLLIVGNEISGTTTVYRINLKLAH